MRLLLRALRLLLGLIYRLIVLVLFERWIPFPERAPAAAPRRVEKQHQAAAALVAPRARRERGPRAGEPAPQMGQPFSSASPACARADSRASTRSAADVARSSARRPWRVLLRDRQALRDALLLDAALAPRRSRL